MKESDRPVQRELERRKMPVLCFIPLFLFSPLLPLLHLFVHGIPDISFCLIASFPNRLMPSSMIFLPRLLSQSVPPFISYFLDLSLETNQTNGSERDAFACGLHCAFLPPPFPFAFFYSSQINYRGFPSHSLRLFMRGRAV